jgi:tetratricopeptide (TPR) repeat protein
MTPEDTYGREVSNELEQFPEDPNVLIKAGSYYFEPGREPDKAVELLSKALKIYPDSTRARFWLAKCLYHDFCNYAESEKLIKYSLQLNPDQPDAISLLASIMADLDYPLNDRISILRKAVELAPNWPLLRLSLAQLLLESGNKAEARSLLMTGHGVGNSYHPVPTTNPTEEYYEYAVTGRNNPECHKSLQSMIQID